MAPSLLSERSCMVVTKIRPSGDLAINRTRFNPSAVATIVKFSGSDNENRLFTFRRTTCGVSFSAAADCGETTDGKAATQKIKPAAMGERITLFMDNMAPLHRCLFE